MQTQETTCRCGCGHPPGRRSLKGYATRGCYSKDPGAAATRKASTTIARHAANRTYAERRKLQTPAERHAFTMGYQSAYRWWKRRCDALEAKMRRAA